MNLSLKVLYFVGFTLGGFIFPLAFFGAIMMAFSIWGDVSKDHDAPGRVYERGGASSRSYKLEENFREVSESPAETAFFNAMVSAFNLKVRDGKLEGDDGLKMDMQVQVMSYRLDFLVDKRLVVEIDGAAWHSSPEAVERDSKRDAALGGAGYHILRIPAKYPLYSPEVAIERIHKAREEVRIEDAKMAAARLEASMDGGAPTGTPVQQITEAIRPKRLFKAISGAIDAAAEVSNELERNAQLYLTNEEEKKKREEKVRTEVKADLLRVYARHRFSQDARWEEIEKCYLKRNDENLDLSLLFDRIEGEEKRERLEIATLKSRVPGYWKAIKYPAASRLSPRRDEEDVDAKPTDRLGLICWLEEKHEFQMMYLDVSRMGTDENDTEQNKHQKPKVSLPTLEDDIFTWREKVEHLKEKHFPLPASLNELEFFD